MRFMFYYVNHIVRVHGRYVSRLLLTKALGIASRARHTYGLEPAACVKQQQKTGVNNAARLGKPHEQNQD